MYTINGYSSDELYHHGVLGQKWGKRQGPPYPLNASEHSAAERKAGYKKSLGGGHNESLYSDGPKAEKAAKKSKNRATTSTSKKKFDKKHLEINKSDSSVTKKVKADYNQMPNREFKQKYSASKRTYAKRVKKYADPYMNAPLAKLAKSNAMQKFNNSAYAKLVRGSAHRAMRKNETNLKVKLPTKLAKRGVTTLNQANVLSNRGKTVANALLTVNQVKKTKALRKKYKNERHLVEENKNW